MLPASGRMQAVHLTGHGDYSKLVITETDIPKPKSNETLIKVLAASVNNSDINARTGWYSAKSDHNKLLSGELVVDTGQSFCGSQMPFPLIQGCDIVGWEVGADGSISNKLVLVDPMLKSDQCVGSEINGGFAEYAVIPSNNVYEVLTRHYSNHELGSIPAAYGTAEQMIMRADMTTSDVILVTGPTGGVGVALIDLLRTRGMSCNIVTSQSKAHFFQGWTNVNKILIRNHPERDYNLKHEIQKLQATLCFDVVGGELLSHILCGLQNRGRIVTSGAIQDPIVKIDMRNIIYREIDLLGVVQQEGKSFQGVLDLVNQNMLKPLVAKIVPLSRIVEAQKEFAQKNHLGKIVMVPDALYDQDTKISNSN